MWQCSIKHPKRQFSVKVGTIFEDSPLGLDKWLPAVWLLSNCKNGISSYEIAPRSSRDPEDRVVHASSYPAWPASRETAASCRREVEADETFIGGKARNMHVT